MGSCSRCATPSSDSHEAEVAAVMAEFGIELNETEVELLTDRTEGWAAGVQMAAPSPFATNRSPISS